MTAGISLRLASMEDADLLLEWRNDPKTRESSRNTDEVQRDDHISWLSRTLRDPNRELYLAEDNGVPVGTVRADFSEGEWELSWTVAPGARGQGIAKEMVSMLANQISEPVRAEVKTGNDASAQIAQHAGMRFDRKADDILHYRRASIQSPESK